MSMATRYTVRAIERAAGSAKPGAALILGLLLLISP
jgi:hypothetical protein